MKKHGSSKLWKKKKIVNYLYEKGEMSLCKKRNPGRNQQKRSKKIQPRLDKRTRQKNETTTSAAEKDKKKRRLISEKAKGRGRKEIF